MATTSEQLPALAETQSKIPWYVQDLPLYLKGFGILTVIYIGLRFIKALLPFRRDWTHPNRLLKNTGCGCFTLS